MRQMKDKLSTTINELEKLQSKYSKVKQSALGYKHANQKQRVIYNELLVNCVGFVDELKAKTDRFLMDKENEIELAVKEFENECKQRRMLMTNNSNVHCKTSSFNTS